MLIVMRERGEWFTVYNVNKQDSIDRYRQQLLLTILPNIEQILPRWQYVCAKPNLIACIAYT